MQATAFDGMTRDLGERSTRRGFLRLLGGAAAAGVAAAVGLSQLAAAKRKRGKKKGKPNGNGQGQPQPAVCTSWIISGGADPTTPLVVDDDLSIMVNGLSILNDSDGKAGPLPPVAFVAQVGDRLDVDAKDVNAACRSLAAVWLHCATTGQKRQLSDGVNDGCAPGRTPGGFFGGAYTVSV